MCAVGRDVCGGLEVGVDVDQGLDQRRQLMFGARYRDKRAVAKKMWATVMAALQAVGALPAKAAS